MALFRDMKAKVESEGFTLEREDPPMQGHRYCLWFNSPSGSKEWFCKNFDEVEQALEQAKEMKESGR